MGKSNNKRYRSYKDKKSQSKKFRAYLIRIIVIIIFYSLFTTFIAIAVNISSDSMSPSINSGDSLILLPTKNLNRIIGSNPSKYLKRGDVVLVSTQYSKEPTLIEYIIDPIVRIFTLQKKSLVFNNKDLKGRAEILRVVGLPGDYIKIKDNIVYIKTLDNEFYLSEFELTKVEYDINKNEIDKSWEKDYPFSSEFQEIVIPENKYFLVSDNREVLNDSRILEPFGREKIIGKFFIKYWPLDEFHFF
ncbi:MAG: signal peptidase I [Spirochaetales bacterium]|nr:signal peptidase I [Spirochaetales bacterium]